MDVCELDSFSFGFSMMEKLTQIVSNLIPQNSITQKVLKDQLVFIKFSVIK